MALSFIFKADGSAYTRGLEKMRSQTSSWSGGISKMIVGAFAAGAVVASIKKIITASSDLSETLSKSRVVFKENSKEVEAWADTLDSRLGQSKAQALDAAAGFASMFHVLGIGPKKANVMSKALVELASDMASFHNTSVEEALAAIGSGLRGEAEPLRKYNVLLNDATLKAEAMSQGLFDGKGALDLTTKAQAAYNVILTQSAVVNGDFENTSDGLANSIRIMKAEITNLAAEFGDNLIPVIREAMKVYEGAKILFGKGVGDQAAARLEERDKKERTGGVQKLLADNLDQAFTSEEFKILNDITSSTSDLDNVMRNHEMTIFDLHKAVIDYMKAEEEEGIVAAKNAASAAENTKAQVAREKELIKQQEKRIKNLEKLREGIAKEEFNALSDEDKKATLEKEKSKVKKTIEFQDTHKPAEGEEDIAEEKRLEAAKRLLEINRELDKIAKSIADRQKKADEPARKAREKEIKKQERIDKKLAEISSRFAAEGPQTSVISSSLASIGGGGNVASFTSDPVLAAATESNKFLAQIEKNTERTPAAPTTPEL